MPSLLPLILLLFASLPLTTAQQYGSFFTAIYLNGAPLPAGQNLCSNMPAPGSQYCCLTSQFCGMDDAGHVACCAAGSQCRGNAQYGAGYYAGAPAVVTTQQCNYCPAPTALQTSYVPAAPTSTVYVAPAPVVVTATSQAVAVQSQTQARAPTTVVVQPGGGQPSTIGPVACAVVSTVTYADVGVPRKTVGCFVIVNAGGRAVVPGMGDGEVNGVVFGMGLLWAVVLAGRVLV